MIHCGMSEKFQPDPSITITIAQALVSVNSDLEQGHCHSAGIIITAKFDVQPFFA